jgi:hypothetical protein
MPEASSEVSSSILSRYFPSAILIKTKGKSEKKILFKEKIRKGGRAGREKEERKREKEREIRVAGSN